MVVVTAQVRFTVPVNPPTGATVTVDVFPVVAPAVTEIAPLLLKENVGVALTVTFTVVVCVIDPDVPVTVIT
jgi:hypothetical protein